MITTRVQADEKSELGGAVESHTARHASADHSPTTPLSSWTAL